MLTSEDIARHTEEYLERGGVISVIPFLATRYPNASVQMYMRVHRYGWRIEAPARTVCDGETILPDAVVNELINSLGGSDA